MKAICVMVSSLNGYTTDGTNPHLHSWTSSEDQKYFNSLIDKATCIIVGRTTYEKVVKPYAVNKSGRLRVILTSNPEKYKDKEIPGQLEFTNLNPIQLLTHLASRGFQEVLLVGGATTNAAFLQENLIDELWLTIEPVIFASGTPLFGKNILQENLQLLSVEKLNKTGTLLLKYNFLRNGRKN